MGIDGKYAYSELTDKIIGIAIKVHKALGPGFVEKFYGKALTRELSKSKIRYVEQKNICVKYDNVPLGIYKVDLILEDMVIVELKVVSEISKINVAQMVSYLKASGRKIGLILNFAKSKLEIKRVIV